MEPDSLSAEFAFPPPPPLLPPPVPPPVGSPSLGIEGESPVSLRRWNDRLALVVGGLTLFLLGIVTGRVFGPGTASDGDLVAIVSTASPSTPAANVIATDRAPYSEEVNPPELVVCTGPAEPIARPESSTSAAETVTAAVSNSTPIEESAEQAAATSAPIEETGPTSTTPAPAATSSQTSPVSLEGKVPTIKPLPSTQVCAPAKKFKDRKLSTALTWAESVQEAAQQAEQEERLVFLIHVSGNFEMPGFT